MTSRADVLVLVPFEHGEGLVTDAATRQTLGGHLFGPISVALSQLEEYVGFHLNLLNEAERPVFGNQRLAVARHRSLTAVTLATHLELAGLSWKVLDPGPEGLRWWRVHLRRCRDLRPRAIGVSTTYIMSSTSMRVLLSMVRDAFPGVPIILGGYYYATDAKDFLSMDADVFVIGEGDVRFPMIVDAIRNGKSIEEIPGLYLRHANGLRYTGPVEPLNLAQLPPANWALSSRIDPPVDIEQDMLEVGLETQRGCVFKCGFCTFRTLTSPNVMTTDVAVDRILDTRSIRYATIMMTDATATFPHERWNEIMRALIEHGGAPHPIWAYARVSDLPAETVELMARAGVKQVFIGQESGDQVILDRMRKGTRLKHVRPAVAALAKNNLTAVMGFIHGYPGETLQTIQTTRELLVSINEGHERRPPVVLYTLSPFYLQDMAGAAESERAMLQVEGDHFFDYRFGQFTSRVLADECLATIIAAGKNPNAPANMFLFGKEKATSNSMILGGAPYPHEVFRWVKTVERGLVTFLESHLEGTPVDGAALRRVKETLLAYYPRRRRLGHRIAAPFQKSALHNQTLVVKRLAREWHEEENRGIGPFTRIMLTSMALRDSGKPGFALRVWRNGSYIAPAAPGASKEEDKQALALAAKTVVDEGLKKGRARLKIVDAEGHTVPNEPAIRVQGGKPSAQVVELVIPSAEEREGSPA